MSTIAVNTITNAAGGNTAQINGMTPTAQSLQGFRNRIINGDMRIDQRNAGASVTLTTGTVLFPVDRFPAIKQTSAATVTAQRSTVAPAGFTNSLLFTASTGASPASGDINAAWQTIEGFNVADFGWGGANAQSVTLSFWVRSSVTGTYSVSFNNSAGNRFYVATYTISAANTWESKTITIPGDTSGTWLTDNGGGIQVTWDLGYGSNFNGSAGAWGSSTIRRTSGSVQLIATTGATFYITGVQLEAGSVATPFERRPYGTELALCQRYYSKSYKQATIPGANDGDGSSSFTNGNTAGTVVLAGNIVFPVEMRAEPTIFLWSNAGVSSQFTASDGIARTAGAGSVSQRQASTLVTSGNNGAIYRCQWVASAEL